MNYPEKETIAKWMDGALEDSELKKVEGWADENPDEAARLIASLETQTTDFSSLPKSIEPPYPDFFNSKLEQEIKQLKQSEPVQVREDSGMRLIDKLKFIFAPAAVAAMIACFYLGTQLGKSPEAESLVKLEQEASNPSREMAKNEQLAKDPVTILENKSQSIVYVPSESVTYEQHDSAEASMIVLDGLDPVADNDIAMIEKVKPEQSVRLILAKERRQDWY